MSDELETTHPGPTNIGFDELEALAHEPEPTPEPEAPDPAIPENLRGRTPGELASYAAGLERSLKLSEEARLATPAPAPARSAPPPEPQAPPMPTSEQLAAAWERDPIQTAQYLAQLGRAQAEAQFERRLGPLLSGLSAGGEADARRRYAEEFELFGAEIESLRDMVHDKSHLSNPEAWDQIISVVRGRPGNIDKIIDRRIKAQQKATETTLADAQAQAARSAPSGSPALRRGPVTPAGASGWTDDTEREIAANLGVTDPREWHRWKTAR